MSSKFSGKCKRGFHRNFRRSWKILEGQPQKYIGWTRPIFPSTPFISGLFSIKFHRKGGWCNYFKYFENHKSYVDEFLHCQYSKVPDSYLGHELFCLFQQIFACEKGISKNGLHWQVKHVPNFNLPSSPLSYSGVISVKMFVLKHWVFL